MRWLSPRSTSKKAPVKGCLQTDHCVVRQHMQPHQSRQRSIGLFAMSNGEGALDYASFGARGIRTYSVQSTQRPLLLLYPSIDALEVSQALEKNTVSSEGLFGCRLGLKSFPAPLRQHQFVVQTSMISAGCEVPGVGTCVVPSPENVSRLQVCMPSLCHQIHLSGSSGSASTQSCGC